MSSSLGRTTLALLVPLLLVAAAMVGTTSPASAATGGPIRLTDNTAKCVDLDVATGRAQIWDCLGGTSQTWTIRADRSIANGSGGCLQTSPGQMSNNTAVTVAACTGGVNQQWSHDGDALRNLAANRCLDLTNGNQGNGAIQLQVYDCLGNPNQTWTLPAAAVGWTAAWGTAMHEGLALNGSANFSCRNVSRISVSGTAVRVHLSNLYDTGSVTFTAVRVAVHGSGAGIADGTSQIVRFGVALIQRQSLISAQRRGHATRSPA